MKFADFFVIVVAFMAYFIINWQSIFTTEVLMELAIVCIIVLVIIIIFIRDYGPWLTLKSQGYQFLDTLDFDAMDQAIERFFAKNKLPSKTFKGYVTKAKVELLKGDYTASMDALLYCDVKDMDEKEKADFYLTRCRTLMFMDQLTKDEEFKYLKDHLNYTNNLSLFMYRGVCAYLAIQEGKKEAADQYLEKMREFNPTSDVLSELVNNEISWVKGMEDLIDGNHDTWLRNLNYLNGCHALPYLVKSYQRQENRMN